MRRGGEGRFLLLDILLVFDIVSFRGIELLVEEKNEREKTQLDILVLKCMVSLNLLRSNGG